MLCVRGQSASRARTKCCVRAYKSISARQNAITDHQWCAAEAIGYRVRNTGYRVCSSPLSRRLIFCTNPTPYSGRRSCRRCPLNDLKGRCHLIIQISCWSRGRAIVAATMLAVVYGTPHDLQHINLKGVSLLDYVWHNTNDSDTSL